MWDFEEAIRYYASQGAPGDQIALTGLLREVQKQAGTCIPAQAVEKIAAAYGVKESFLLAVIRRVPSLRLALHRLEICIGPRCGKSRLPEAAVQQAARAGVEIRYTGCMHRCAEGPCIRWDGNLYSRADGGLILKLLNRK